MNDLKKPKGTKHEKRGKGGELLFCMICLFPVLCFVLMIAANCIAVATFGLVHANSGTLALVGLVGFGIFGLVGYALLVSYRNLDRRRKGQSSPEYEGVFGARIRPTENSVAFLLFIGVAFAVVAGLLRVHAQGVLSPPLTVPLLVSGATGFFLGFDRMRQRAEIRRRRRNQIRKEKAAALKATVADRPEPTEKAMTSCPDSEVGLAQEREVGTSPKGGVLKSHGQPDTPVRKRLFDLRSKPGVALILVLIAGIAVGGWISFNRHDEAMVSGKPISLWVEQLCDRNWNLQRNAADELAWAKPEDLQRHERQIRRAANDGNHYAQAILARCFDDFSYLTWKESLEYIQRSEEAREILLNQPDEIREEVIAEVRARYLSFQEHARTAKSGELGWARTAAAYGALLGKLEAKQGRSVEPKQHNSQLPDPLPLETTLAPLSGESPQKDPPVERIVLPDIPIILKPKNEEEWSDFRVPNVVSLSYPTRFVRYGGFSEEELRRMIEDAGVPNLVDPADLQQIFMAYLSRDSVYCHCSVTVGPSELSQTELAALGDEEIDSICGLIELETTKVYESKGWVVIQEYEGSRKRSNTGVFYLEFSGKLRKLDGSVRNQIKRIYYGEKRTVIVSLMSSPSYKEEFPRELKSIADSIRVIPK